MGQQKQEEVFSLMLAVVCGGIVWGNARDETEKIDLACESESA